MSRLTLLLLSLSTLSMRAADDYKVIAVPPGVSSHQLFGSASVGRVFGQTILGNTEFGWVGVVGNQTVSGNARTALYTWVKDLIVDEQGGVIQPTMESFDAAPYIRKGDLMRINTEQSGLRIAKSYWEGESSAFVCSDAKSRNLVLDGELVPAAWLGAGPHTSANGGMTVFSVSRPTDSGGRLQGLYRMAEDQKTGACSLQRLFQTDPRYDIVASFPETGGTYLVRRWKKNPGGVNLNTEIVRYTPDGVLKSVLASADPSSNPALLATECCVRLITSNDRRSFAFTYRSADGSYRLAKVGVDGTLTKEWAKFDWYAVLAALNNPYAAVLTGSTIDQLDGLVRVDSAGNKVPLNKEKVLQKTGITIPTAGFSPLKLWLDGQGNITFGIEGVYDRLVWVAGKEFDYVAPPPVTIPVTPTPTPPSRITERPRKPFVKLPHVTPREQKR